MASSKFSLRRLKDGRTLIVDGRGPCGRAFPQIAIVRDADTDNPCIQLAGSLGLAGLRQILDLLADHGYGPN